MRRFPMGSDAFFARAVAGHAALLLRDREALARWRGEVERYVPFGRWLSLASRTLLAGEQHLAGDRDGAVERFRAAVAGWRDLAAPFDLALCLLEYAAALPEHDPAREDARTEARAILAGLGADAFGRRVERWLLEVPASAASLPPGVGRAAD